MIAVTIFMLLFLIASPLDHLEISWKLSRRHRAKPGTTRPDLQIRRFGHVTRPVRPSLHADPEVSHMEASPPVPPSWPRKHLGFPPSSQEAACRRRMLAGRLAAASNGCSCPRVRRKKVYCNICGIPDSFLSPPVAQLPRLAQKLGNWSNLGLPGLGPWFQQLGKTFKQSSSGPKWPHKN
jgi:hypothetical protein